VRSPLSEPLDPLLHDDPVAAVVAAHRHGRLLRLATSGSSGHARRVVRTTASWWHSFPHVARLTGLDEQASVWVPGPPAGTMNLFARVLCAVLGARVVSEPLAATHAHLTPTELRRWLASSGRLDGMHLTVAGDRLDPDLHAAALGRGAAVAHYYGAAELSFVGWGSHAGDLEPFPGAEVREREGVLWVRSPYLAQVPTDADGFATVGDRGALLPDGRIAVHGRGDTAVLTGGATVLVEDVEAALRPAVSCDLVVVGLPHADLGAVVAAVLTDRRQVAAAHERARAALAETHRPRMWFVLDPLPVTAAGKPDRSLVGRRAAAGELRRVSPAGVR
jgi:long-chain acyl-CoA synthetase